MEPYSQEPHYAADEPTDSPLSRSLSLFMEPRVTMPMPHVRATCCCFTCICIARS